MSGAESGWDAGFLAVVEKLEHGRGAWVSLVFVRRELARLGHGRAVQDRCFRRLARAGVVRFHPETDRTTLDQERRDAAVRIEGRNCHFLQWVGARPR